jgi:hypothetical protein
MLLLKTGLKNYSTATGALAAVFAPPEPQLLSTGSFRAEDTARLKT